MRLWPLGLIVLLHCFCLAGLSAQTPEIITRIDQAAPLLGSNALQTLPARLSGVVYGLSPTRQSLVLKDDTGFLWVETSHVPREVEPGARVSIAGSLTLGNGQALFGRSPATNQAAPANRIEKTGSGTLSAPSRVVPGQLWGELPDPSWIEAEGTVRQVGTHAGRLVLEVSAVTGRMQVILAEEDSIPALALLNRRVRVRGLGWGAVTPQGSKVAGVLLVPSRDHLTLLGPERTDSTSATNSQSLPTLTSIEQIRRLKLQEAERHYPVKFKGVVTFLFPGGTRAHVQGETEGLYVAGTRSASPLQLGTACELEGYTSGVNISPVVAYRRCTVLGPGLSPEPLRPPLHQLLNGSLDAQWVEVQGVVLSAKNQDLVLGLRQGQITARLFEDTPPDLTPYVGAVVRVRGTVRAFLGQQHQVRSVIIQLPTPLNITVDTPAPADPFSVAAKRIPELLLFDPNAGSIYFVKTPGQIVHARAGTFYLMDGTNGLRFTTREKTSATPGDLVEVVGIPENDGRLPLLNLASVRTVGRAPLPPPRLVSMEQLAGGGYDSTLVQVEGTLLNRVTNKTDQVLELQADSRLLVARLSRRHGTLPGAPPGSRVRLSGVFTTQTDAAPAIGLPSFELLLNSPADLAVLQRPFWWTRRHTFLALGTLSSVAAAAWIWIRALRRRVEQRTRELTREIAEHHRTNGALNEKTRLLLAEIEERKRLELERESIHRQLVYASHQAGQAEVAASVLHNVGNVLNSVNVSAALLAQRIGNMRLSGLSKAAALLQANAAASGGLLAPGGQGHALPQYLTQLARYLSKEQQEMLQELQGLGQNVDHIAAIVAMQQDYARMLGVVEQTTLTEMVESALKLDGAAFQRHGIKVLREYQAVPPVTLDKHKLLQILVNLLHNAQEACAAGSSADKTIIVRIQAQAQGRVRVEVADNGIGIAPENRNRLFRHGFTTRKNGHGFGLHSAALAAKEMEGTLTAHSDGLGKGATFILELPLQPSKKNPSSTQQQPPSPATAEKL